MKKSLLAIAALGLAAVGTLGALQLRRTCLEPQASLDQEASGAPAVARDVPNLERAATALPSPTPHAGKELAPRPKGELVPQETVRSLVQGLEEAFRAGRTRDLSAPHARIRAQGATALPELVDIIRQEGAPLLRLFALNAFLGLRTQCESLPAYDQALRTHVFNAARALIVSDEGDQVRTNAVFILASCPNEGVKGLLLDTASDDRRARIQQAALTALENRRESGTSVAVLGLLEGGLHGDSATRFRAARLVLDLSDVDARKDAARRLYTALGEELEDTFLDTTSDNPGLRYAALHVFARVAPLDRNSILVALLEQETNVRVLQSAASILLTRAEEAATSLDSLAQNPNAGQRARLAAQRTLESLRRGPQ